MIQREQKLEQIKQWIADNNDIRAALITSSLVNPLAPVDDFSDLDIELVLEPLAPYVADATWINLFGEPMIYYEEGPESFEGKHSMIMVQYMDSVKVDFKLYSVAQFQQELAQLTLPEDWDIGYEVLADKDGLTRDLAPPSHQVSIIKKPSEERFQRLLHDFYWDMTYLPKCLARGDLFYLKYMMEHIIRVEYFIPMLEWHIASRNDWKISTNKNGRLFKQYISGMEWDELEHSFAGANLQENWDAAFTMLHLFHNYAKELAVALGYPYSSEPHDRIAQYFETIYRR